MTKLLNASLLAGMLGALTACTNPSMERAQVDVIGVSENTLFSCAGAPDRVERKGKVQHLTYSRSAIWGIGTSGPCDVTFTVEDGKVADLSYSDPNSVYQCGEVVRHCIKC